MTRGRWKTSSYSQPNGNCVEVRCGRATLGTTVQVRDSKDPNGGYLTMPFTAWTAFIAAVKRT